MPARLEEKVAFDFIRYANCWEDADILLEGLRPAPDSRILSIGSAGDNSFSLLTTHPKQVVAVDINLTQLYLIELKKVAMQHLSYAHILAFLGFIPSDNRIDIFHTFSHQLRTDTRQYWQHHLSVIRQGVATQGKFERYFQFFSTRLLPWIHSRKTIEELLKPKSPEAQIHFYQKHWNTWRWRGIFKLFFSRYVLGKYGRDPEFMNEVQLSVGSYIFQKAETHLQQTQAQENGMLRYILTGSFGSWLPHYLQPDHFQKIKPELDKLQLFHGLAEDAVKTYGRFQSMNLSNIFEYMNPSLFAATAQPLAEALEPGGRLAYWNLMVPRRISAVLPAQLVYQTEESQWLSARDKGFFYNQFILEQKQ